MSIIGNPVMLGSRGGGGGSVIVPKTITANGIYNASADSANGYNPVTVAVPTAIEEWDFTSATPLVGTLRGITLTAYNMTYDSSGAVFNGATDYLLLGSLFAGSYAFEVDVASMDLPILSSNHQRFIMGSDNGGLIYRYNSHQWEFYGNGAWATSSGEGASDFFDGATVRVEIDSSSYWHIYKNGVLWYEPNQPQTLSSVRLGSNANSLRNATISAFRWM